MINKINKRLKISTLIAKKKCQFFLQSYCKICGFPLCDEHLTYHPIHEVGITCSLNCVHFSLHINMTIYYTHFAVMI